jgi:hypothetical protein
MRNDGSFRAVWRRAPSSSVTLTGHEHQLAADATAFETLVGVDGFHQRDPFSHLLASA